MLKKLLLAMPAFVIATDENQNPLETYNQNQHIVQNSNKLASHQENAWIHYTLHADTTQNIHQPMHANTTQNTHQPMFGILSARDTCDIFVTTTSNIMAQIFKKTRTGDCAYVDYISPYSMPLVELVIKVVAMICQYRPQDSFSGDISWFVFDGLVKKLAVDQMGCPGFFIWMYTKKLKPALLSDSSN